MTRPAWLAAVAALGLATQIEAQTNDVYFRSWRFLNEPSSARAAALAGAVTALPDDLASLEWNPGGLARLDKPQLVMTGVSRQASQTRVGDSLARETGFGFVGAGGRLSSRWAIGAYALEPQSAHVELSGGPAGDGALETGRLEGSVTDVGFGVGFRLNPRVHLGVRLTSSHIELAGNYSRQRGSSPAVLQVSTSGSDRAQSVSAGALIELSPRWFLGLAHLGGNRWSLRRTATSPALGETLEAGRDYEVRRPSITSGGLGLRLSPKLLALGQLDYVRYGEIAGPLLPGGYSDLQYQLVTWEWRLALEASLPLRSASLQLRAGIHDRPPQASFGGAVSTAAAVESAPGPQPPSLSAREALLRDATALRPQDPSFDAYPGTRLSVGAALVTSRGLRFDMAWRFGGDRPGALASLSVQF